MKKILFAVFAVVAVGFASCGDEYDDSTGVDTAVVDSVDSVDSVAVDSVAK